MTLAFSRLSFSSQKLPTPVPLNQATQCSNQEVSRSNEEVKKKKPIRQAVGLIVIDPRTKKVLLLSSRKREEAFVLPRGECQTDPSEPPEKAALRILFSEAGVNAHSVTRRIGTFTEANKKGKITAHHWIYEVQTSTLLKSWPSSDRRRVWVPLNQALMAISDRPISHMALKSSSLCR